MVIGPIEIILRIWDALDICDEVAFFIKHGPAGWRRMRHIDRWKAEKRKRR